MLSTPALAVQCQVNDVGRVSHGVSDKVGVLGLESTLGKLEPKILSLHLVITFCTPTILVKDKRKDNDLTLDKLHKHIIKYSFKI